MNNSQKEKLLVQKIESEYQNSCPGLKGKVLYKGKTIASFDIGNTYKYYDVASLTKIIFSVTTVMELWQQKRISEFDSINKVIQWYHDDKVQWKHLLCHHAGFPWWEPFFKKLAGEQNPVPVKNEVDQRARWSMMKQILRDEKANFPNESKYSDIDFLFIGMLLEQIKEKPLLEIWEEKSLQLDMPDTHFQNLNQTKFKKELYAPTEECKWRKELIQGVVHDENTWAMGGVSSHAGLFSTLEDVFTWTKSLRDGYIKDQHPFLLQKTIRYFTKRAVDPSYGDWALGFMMPSKGKASCGEYFDLESVGHTGFTGTSIWFDVKKDLAVVILSNRIHPSRDNQNFLQLRPKIHNWIYEIFLGESL